MIKKEKNHNEMFGVEGMESSGFYTIGEFSRLCNLSAKQLRYYDKIGLISPAYRDEWTGYRYYTIQQLEETIAINQLFMLDFPLSRIKSIVASRDPHILLLALRDHERELRESLRNLYASYCSTVDTIMRISSSSVFEPASIGVTIFPRSRIVSTRRQSVMNAEILLSDRKAELLSIIQRHQISVTGAQFSILHSGYMQQFTAPEQTSRVVGDLELFYKVDSLSKETEAPGEGEEFSVRIIPDFKAVTGRHIGPYSSLKFTYLAMEQWARDKGIGLEKISIEEYLINSAMAKDENDYVTKIYIPIKGSVLTQ